MLRSFVAVVFRFVSAVVLCRGDFTTRKNKHDVSLTKSTASSDVSLFPVLVFVKETVHSAHLFSEP